MFDSLLGETDEDRMSILTKVSLSAVREEEVITYCRDHEDQLSYRAVINLVRELKAGLNVLQCCLVLRKEEKIICFLAIPAQKSLFFFLIFAKYVLTVCFRPGSWRRGVRSSA